VMIYCLKEQMCTIKGHKSEGLLLAGPKNVASTAGFGTRTTAESSDFTTVWHSRSCRSQPCARWV